MQAIDKHDKQILKHLQVNSRITTEELGRLVNLSQSAVQRRITRMRKERIIEAEIVIVSPKVAEIGITSVVDVVLKEGNSKAIDEFKQSMKNCKEVSQSYYVTGTYDFVLIVQTRDMSHFEEFTKKKLMDDPNLKHFYTHVVMDQVKMNYGVKL